MHLRAALAAGLILAAASPGQAQERPRAPVVTAYPALAELALGAPVIALGEVSRVSRIPDRRATGLRPGLRRYLIRVDLKSALKAPGPVPARIEFLWDVGGTRRPELLNRQVIAFLVAGEGGYRLTGPGGLIAAEEASLKTLRAQIAEAKSPELGAGRVTGVTRAFTVAGTVPGEAESQFFLATASGEPVSLVVISRPGEAKRVTAAFGDVIDENAPQIRAGTLQWYYLACGLPRTLPPDAVADLEPGDRMLAAADYSAALDAIGPCAGSAPAKEASSTETVSQSG